MAGLTGVTYYSGYNDGFENGRKYEKILSPVFEQRKLIDHYKKIIERYEIKNRYNDYN